MLLLLLLMMVMMIAVHHTLACLLYTFFSAFFFLFRWLDSGRTSNAAMLGLLYAIQALGNAYYAVYLAFFASLVLLAGALRRRSWSSRRFWLQLALAAGIAITLMGPEGEIEIERETGMDAMTEFRALPSVDLPAGEYSVDWRGLSSDGHPMQGGFSFTVAD